MTIKVGKREVVFSTSLIIPKSESADFQFLIGAWKIEIMVSFEDDKASEGTRNILFEHQNSQLHLKFVNWNNSLGTALTKPVEIGRTNTNQELSFIATHWLVGEINKVDFQFMLEVAK